MGSFTVTSESLCTHPAEAISVAEALDAESAV